jgi:hypothetical protein
MKKYKKIKLKKSWNSKRNLPELKTLVPVEHYWNYART